MMGRTHLQDAVPITLGQVIGGWAAQIDDTLGVVSASLPGLHALALGGTAVGTGLNAHPKFGATASDRLAQETGQPFHVTPQPRGGACRRTMRWPRRAARCAGWPVR